jgi:glycerophosphoryl diester phosphodiesterase
MNEHFLNPLPIVVAHRGDSKNYPENTLEAFVSAYHMGIDVIETDVHLSKDGVVVVWHDDTLERNTDGSGLIEDHTLEELKRLDAAFTYTADRGLTYPFRGKGIRIATLAEALEACPGQRFNVDLKSKTPLIVDTFIEVVMSHQAQDRVLCASFHLSNLKLMRRRCPVILTSLTTKEVVPLLARQKLGLLPRHQGPQSRTLVFQVPVRQWGIEVITPSFIKDFHKMGAIIQVWTINDRQEMLRLFRLGVDTIMTDNPAVVIDVARELHLR